MFEQSLLAPQRRSKTRVVVIPVAIAVHALALAGVAVAQYWSVDPVAEPSIQVSFLTAREPPPQAPAGPSPAPKPRGSERQQPIEVVVEPVQPIRIPLEIPETPDQPEMSGVPDGVPDGLPHGVADGRGDGQPRGVPWGVSRGIGGGGVVPGDGSVIHVEGDVEKPEILERVQPAYTEIARRARIQGVVVVEAIIDTGGRVTDVRVLKSLPMGLSESAMEAVKQWRFKPATLNQRPVSVYFTLTVKFELQ